MRTQHIVWILLLFTGYLYAQDQEGTQVIIPSAQGLHPSTLPTSDGLPTYLQQVENQARPQAQAKGPAPFSVQQVVKEIKKYTADTVVKDVVARGVDFDMTPSLEQKLRQAEASDDEVEAVRQSGPKGARAHGETGLWDGLGRNSERPQRASPRTLDYHGGA